MNYGNSTTLLMLFVTVLSLETETKTTEPIIKHLQVGKIHYIDAGKGHYGFTREDNGVIKT